MSENENAQTQPNLPPPLPGPTVVELQVQLDEIKKQSEGRLRDLQQERAKRQELEARTTQAAPPPVNEVVVEDEVEKLIRPIVQKHLAPIVAQQSDEKALAYLSSKTGKTVEQVLADTDLQDKLMGVARKWNIVGDSFVATKRAYELMELEGFKTKEEERTRTASAASAATLPAGTSHVSTPSAKKYSADEFKGMTSREFDEKSKSGHFRKLSDGTFEYTPR